MVRMLEFLKKIFFALLPFLQKAAEEALNEAASSQGSEGSHEGRGTPRILAVFTQAERSEAFLGTVLGAQAVRTDLDRRIRRFGLPGRLPRHD